MKQLLTILSLLLCPGLMAATITVGKDQVITSVRKAVAMAYDGDTILVHKGLYKEGNIVINKSVRLIGIGGPVLDGEGKYEILTVSAQGVLIKGITFANAGYSSVYDYAAIKVVDSDNIIIENNIVTNAYFAIHIANVTSGIVRNNRVRSNATTEQGSGNGVHLWKCSEMVVEDNHLEGHRDGIYLEFVTHSIIQDNISIRNVRYGLHFMFSNDDAYMNNVFRDNGAGVAVMFSNRVLMHSNTFEHNWGSSAYGLLLKEISDGRIIHNTFVQNTTAIHMEGANRMEVQRNSFRNNGWAMRIQASSIDNTFFHNNFGGNTFDVATNGATAVNRYYNNYWDKYEGYDLDRNGVGDVPYHPVSMYSMIIEQNPTSLLLLRSFMVSLLDKAEKALPSLTPENLVDDRPLMKPLHL
ncbi:MAG TPA: nitrous oxide reductase family maturation protein NosD [Chitinophagaceae bacterium]